MEKIGFQESSMVLHSFYVQILSIGSNLFTGLNWEV